MMRKRAASDNMRTFGGVKVLLCEDIKELGWLGDVVEVNAGYARNYLLPQGLAVIPTEANLKSLAGEKAKRSEQRKRDKEQLEKTVAAVEGAEAVIAARANEQGILFGSVGKVEIARNLREQGFEVSDEMVQLVENIKKVGTHSITVKFLPDLASSVNVVVVAAGENVESLKEPEKESDQKKGGQQKQSS